MTPAGHLLSGYLAGKWTPGPAADRRRMIVAALIGSVAPDVDVALGLIAGWAGASAHRGATHSFLGAVVLGLLIALLLGRPRRPLFLAAFGGVLTHIFWDWLNPWGVRPFWPWQMSVRGNLVHEGDLYATAIVFAAAMLVFVGRGRLAAAVLVVAVPGYLALQVAWRDHARTLAESELAGRRVAIYPTDKLGCGWTVLSAGDGDMSVDCATSPWSGHLRRVYRGNIRDSAATRASEQSPMVREFREKIPFSFAEVWPAEDGGTIVVWRDLRVAFRERATTEPAGLYVRLDAGGRILSEHHRWWLSLW